MAGENTIVRRSVAVPDGLVRQAMALAPAAIQDNFNRIVIVALQDYVAGQKRTEFEREVEAMASDPAIRREITAIEREFRETGDDGLIDQRNPLNELVHLMRQCEDDTRVHIGKGEAARLGKWRAHEGDLRGLVRFVSRRVESPNGKVNGWKLFQLGKLSLEEIVARRFPDLFDPETVRIAEETLGGK